MVCIAQNFNQNTEAEKYVISLLTPGQPQEDERENELKKGKNGDNQNLTRSEDVDSVTPIIPRQRFS